MVHEVTRDWGKKKSEKKFPVFSPKKVDKMGGKISPPFPIFFQLSHLLMKTKGHGGPRKHNIGAKEWWVDVIKSSRSISEGVG